MEVTEAGIAAVVVEIVFRLAVCAGRALALALHVKHRVWIGGPIGVCAAVTVSANTGSIGCANGSGSNNSSNGKRCGGGGGCAKCD